MLMIRFQRFGKRNQPVYRVVVTEKQNGPRSGKFLEILGFYNPQTKERNLKADRINHWLTQGAKTSGTLHNLLLKEGIIKGKKIDVSSRKTSKKGKEENAESTTTESTNAESTNAESTDEVPPSGEVPPSEEVMPNVKTSASSGEKEESNKEEKKEAQTKEKVDEIPKGEDSDEKKG